MNKHIENNRRSIDQNKQGIDLNASSIQENKRRIRENRSEIDKVREEARWMYESSQARMERIVQRQIILIAILVIINAAWVLAWCEVNNIMVLKIIIYISGLVGGFLVGYLTGVKNEQGTKDRVSRKVQTREKKN